MTIFGDGSQTRAFTAVEDVAPLMADALEVPAGWNDVFNIGADEPHSVEELARRTAAAMGVRAEIVHLPARHEVRHAYSTHEKLRRVFGARPRTSLDEGLRAMAAWAPQHGARASAPFRRIEITRNLPGAWLGA